VRDELARRESVMERLSTGDSGLDQILGGGLPAGALLVLAGPPGSGKTILAQQICFANASAERKALYYTTWSEPHDKLMRHLEPFGFFDLEAIGDRIDFLHLAELVDGDESSGLERAAGEVLRQSMEAKPAVIVIDSSKALHDFVEADKFRKAIYDLASKVAYSNAVLILVGEYDPGEIRSQPEFAVADGILQLENEARGPVDRRWLRVLKLRGAEAAPGQHSFRISAAGFEVFPRLETTLPRQVPTQTTRASFGLETLDDAIGGGIPRGDSTLLIGPSGVGKTLLAISFLAAGLKQGERCLHVSLQETEAQVREKAATLGSDWSGLDEEQLVVRHIPPVELDLDQVGALIRDELARGDVKRVVVDSLAELAFAARETERLPAYIWALGGFIRAAGGTTIFTNEMAALGSGDMGGLSFLFNNVFFLRYVEIESALRRGLNVLKMRQSDHEKGLIGFTIDDEGITFGDRIEGLSGMLGWGALRGEA
jgi:circadian clock protein KaiC